MKKAPKFPSTYEIRRIKTAIEQLGEPIGAISIEPRKITFHFAENVYAASPESELDKFFREEGIP